MTTSSVRFAYVTQPCPLTKGPDCAIVFFKTGMARYDMKILVATSDRQGERANDFNFCTEGEPVIVLPACCAELDEDCGCLRGMGGVYSRKATTTFRVANVGSIDNVRSYAYLIRQTMNQMELAKGHKIDALRNHSKDMARELLLLASLFPEGTVLERRGGEGYQIRWQPPTEDDDE